MSYVFPAGGAANFSWQGSRVYTSPGGGAANFSWTGAKLFGFPLMRREGFEWVNDPPEDLKQWNGTAWVTPA